MRSLILAAIISITIIISGCENKITNKTSQKDNCSLFNKTLNKSRSEFGVPGISLSTKLPNGQIINCAQGVKNIKTKAPVTTDTLFQIGSVTKTFVSTLVLLEVDANKLSLNETIGETVKKYGQWLPKKAEQKWKDITIKQLLNMTAGIYSYTESDEFNKIWKAHPTQDWNSDSVIKIALNNPAYFKPGKGWHYSDTNYYLLGLLLEKISHKKLSVLINEKLLKPFNIQNIYYLPENYNKQMFQRISQGYGYNYINRTNVNMSQAGAAGAMVARPADLLNWLSKLFSGKIIKKSLLKQMLTPYSKINGSIATNPKTPAYGLGIFRSYYPDRGGINWGYMGGTWGYLTWYDWNPSKNILYVVSSNIGMAFKDKNGVGGGYQLIQKIFPPLQKQIEILSHQV